ncbi:MAG: hypothetical protein FWH29_00565 [Methanobrevibacter sp.]|nr:hypothetical protein [Methanobrevibacter sp.]
MKNKNIKSGINLLCNDKIPKKRTIIQIAIFSEIATGPIANERIIKCPMKIIKKIKTVKIAIPKIEWVKPL